MKYIYTTNKKAISVFTFARRILIALLIICCGMGSTALQAQSSLWENVSFDRSKRANQLMPNQPAPRNRTLYKLSLDEMIDRTGVAKSETKSKSTSPATQITLPMPDGTFKDFRIWESSLMEKGLADKFPEIQTYIIKGKNDPTVSGRMMVSPYEFSAFFAAPAKGYEVFVRKVYKGDANTYMSYYGKDDPTRREELQCGFEEDLNANPPVSLSSLEKALVAPDTGPELLLFRLAISFPGATSEYNGYATKAEALAGIVSFLVTIQQSSL